MFKAEMEVGRVNWPVGLRFFDRSVKPVETPVKFSFLAIKRLLSISRNIVNFIENFIYSTAENFIVNKTFYKKKTVLTSHTF